MDNPDPIDASQNQVPYQLGFTALDQTRSKFLADVRSSYALDKRIQKILLNPIAPHRIDNGLVNNDRDPLAPRLVLPNDPNLINRILRDEHTNSGHLGVHKTYELVRRKYCWSHQFRSVRLFIHECTSCQQNKSNNQKPAGLLHPVEIPHERWTHISYDTSKNCSRI